jgi:CxxC motif-containing protein (DUF1111 family)
MRVDRRRDARFCTVKKKICITVFFALLASLAAILPSCRKEPEALQEEDYNDAYSGGSQTVFITGGSAFSQPFLNLNQAQDAVHETGDIAFEATFVSDYNAVNHRGLGPVYNNVSCGSCHVADGRGKPPLPSDSRSSLLLRLSVPGSDAHGGPLDAPLFGGQLQQKAIFGVSAEASFTISYTEQPGTFPDGETYSLRVPGYNLSNPYVPFPAQMMVSPRLAPPVFGLGLLEAIPDAELLQKQDISDADGDGVSGKANMVWDFIKNTSAIGRFGWKAGHPTILQQSAGAYNQDMGITNFIFKKEACAEQIQYDHMEDEVEVSDSLLHAVAFYMRSLAVPGRRNNKDETVKNGKMLFKQIGCEKCHTAMHKTKVDVAFPAISNQTIFPYTDLLLHDMGTALADNRPDYLADGQEWKTPPLWGIGLTQVVNGHKNFLHDGRARDFVEAIIWHGGEAESAKMNFSNLSKADRTAVIRFLESL